MNNKINKFSYWFVFSIVLSIVIVLYSHEYRAENIIMILSLTIASSTCVHLLIDVIFKFNAPDFFQYNEDIFYNVKWNWDWTQDKHILHLTPSCPTCNQEVNYVYDHLLSQTEFVCNHCNVQIANINSSDRNFVVESVKKSIIRKLKKEEQKTSE
ncbi:MAG: hypothetical protein ACNI3C_09695 [Candidatus Marinarcus sp.]|uniref:hypothetical protein n=1 Tax=Candidatus Marinarcus sp. TaxID=3100987 RepID=UPI003AFFDF4A